jgi:hypothetical protein
MPLIAGRDLWSYRRLAIAVEEAARARYAPVFGAGAATGQVRAGG